METTTWTIRLPSDLRDEIAKRAKEADVTVGTFLGTCIHEKADGHVYKDVYKEHPPQQGECASCIHLTGQLKEMSARGENDARKLSDLVTENAGLTKRNEELMNAIRVQKDRQNARVLVQPDHSSRPDPDPHYPGVPAQPGARCTQGPNAGRRVANEWHRFHFEPTFIGDDGTLYDARGDTIGN